MLPLGPQSRDLGREPGEDLERVADDPVIRYGKYRCIGVFVDSDDRLGRSHSGEVLDRTRNADRKIELWRDGFACLAHLLAVGPPSRIHDSPRGSQGCSRAQGAS